MKLDKKNKMINSSSMVFVMRDKSRTKNYKEGW